MPVIIYSNNLIDDVRRVFKRHSKMDRLAGSHNPLLVEALREVGALTWTVDSVLERLNSRGSNTRIWSETRNAKIARELCYDAETQLRAYYRLVYGSCCQCGRVLSPAEPGSVRCGVHIDHPYTVEGAPYGYTPQIAQSSSLS